jgi:uncharacterized membrane protein YqiK
MISGSLIGIAIVAAFVLFIVITKLMYICQPNEVLIFSGAKRRLADGRVMGYQIIKGGRRIRKPLVQVVDRMDLTNMPIELAVTASNPCSTTPSSASWASIAVTSCRWPRKPWKATCAACWPP